MSAYNTLEHILREVLEVLKTLQEDWVTRSQFIKELRGVVESVESLRGAAVEPFGSFVSNLFTRWSDMDISINLPKGGYISYVENDRKQSLSKKEKKRRKRLQNFFSRRFTKSYAGSSICIASSNSRDFL
ncbi:protein HESO1-like isoform X1 [Quercus robur]|uniref:protein HESO1-like isoform X1 n=1 Tax=Quercus robur TaxID=38942 RepID=UPI0021613283|nr:protein HESO1-like isoform X1 [Quercus robur]